MQAALVLLVIQGALGAFDTLYYHEWKQRLPVRTIARTELRLHASRDFAYAAVFGSLGWVAWHGVWAWVFAGILLFEILITLWDFVEEDLSRKLPAGERIMHTIMAIVYGAFLAYLIPHVIQWTQKPTAFSPVFYGWLSYLMSMMAVGVFLSGVRDAWASFRMNPKPFPEDI